MMVKTKGGLKIKDFGKFHSQDPVPHTFRGKVKVEKDNWVDAEWDQEGNCINMKGDEFFIGRTKHIPTTKDEIIHMSREEKLERAFFFVNADDFAKFELWRANKYEKEEKYKVDWVEDNCGFGETIGTLYRKNGKKYEPMPVTVTCMFAILNGVYVCFYTSDSMVTDWKMVEDFISQYAGQYDSASRRAMTNATNFHHCTGYCRNPH